MKTKFPLLVLFVLLVPLLAACGGQERHFSAPEIDPPSDLIPGYIPEGYEMVAGFEIEVSDMSGRFLATGDDGRVFCGEGLIIPFFVIKSPAGNDLLGVYYEDDDDGLLLISKSSFPGGTLEAWRTNYEEAVSAPCESDCDCDCCCCNCIAFAIDGWPIPLRAEILETRTVGDTQVAVLESEFDGLITVFVRDGYLIAVEGDLPLEEHLRIIESLLE
jgi:hypothetical protein